MLLVLPGCTWVPLLCSWALRLLSGGRIDRRADQTAEGRVRAGWCSGRQTTRPLLGCYM